jgi:hypothetical protein
LTISTEIPQRLKTDWPMVGNKIMKPTVLTDSLLKDEIHEATAVDVALGGVVAEWPARFVFMVIDELEKKTDKEKD